MKLLRTIQFTLCLLILSISAQAQSVWIDSEREGDTVYFLKSSPAEIARYDLSTESWMAPITLTEAALDFTINSSHIYISYGRRLERMDLDGTNMDN